MENQFQVRRWESKQVDKLVRGQVCTVSSLRPLRICAIRFQVFEKVRFPAACGGGIIISGNNGIKASSAKERRLRMMHTLTKNWWLLGLYGVVDAIISVIYFMIYDAGADATPIGGWYPTVVLLSRLSVAAGVLAIAAGIWRSADGISWLLVLNGLAFSAYGLIPILFKGPLSFRPFALLIVVMSMSFGVLALAIARTMRHRGHGADKWLFGLAGAASVGFASVFLALANGWIPMERGPFHFSFFLWLCLFFGFSAICMLGLSPQLRRLGLSRSDPGEILSPRGQRRQLRNSSGGNLHCRRC